MLRTVGQSRFSLVLAMFVYIACFQWMYINYLEPTWAYFGFEYYAVPTRYVLLSWILSLLPCLWMPMRLQRPSCLIYWVLYVTVFIPSMFVPLHAGLNSGQEVAPLMWTFSAGFMITGLSYLVPLVRLRTPKISRNLFWQIFGFTAAGLALWMAVVFRSNLHLVSFLDVYDLRDASNDLAEGSLVNYAFMLLTGAINPFLMGCGLYLRKRWLFVAGAAGQLLVYAVGGTKGSILSIFFVLGFYLLFRIRNLLFAHKLAFSALALLASACLLFLWTGRNPGPIQAVGLFVVLMRTLSINGLLTAQYFNFFQSNPLTYYSHIKIVNLFVHYPYKYAIGQEIGVAFAGTPDLDATAHFWATDGIAGLGLPGIVLMSILCAFVFWILDSVAGKHDPYLAALVTCYAGYNIANISLFTSLYSGGFALLILTLYLMPRVDRSDSLLAPSPRLATIPS
jgi:hypothetical protein